MTTHAERIRLQLAHGPVGARQLLENMGISQPTLSRALASMGRDVVRMGAARSIQYALRDNGRGLADMPVFQIDAGGTIQPLGVLVPVRPDGFVMLHTDGRTLHSDGLPWWLLDMRPQGFLGRAYAARHARVLGLPTSLSEWSDTHALRALLAHGHDAAGNLLLGEVARHSFVHAPEPQPVPLAAKGPTYASLAQAAISGEIPGTSAGGEQPKFTAFVQTPQGPRHVLVKFTQPDAQGTAATNPVIQRWRDLLLAEHHALQTLRSADVPAAASRITDHAGQRFLEVERFDRVGTLGRRGVLSLAAVEAEFVGQATAPWPVIAAKLASGGHITRDAADGAALLYAFGILSGNTDMHNGNLSLLNDQGRPYTLAPAYDMLPMGFAPHSGGSLPTQLPPPSLHASVRSAVWVQALGLADCFLARLQAETGFSGQFQPCLDSLARHIQDARTKIARLGLSG